MGHATYVHLEDLAAVAEGVVEVQDPVGDLVGAADEDHLAGVVAGFSTGWWCHGSADLRGAGDEHAMLVVEVGGLGVAVVGSNEAVDGDRDVGGVGGVAGLFPGFAVARPVGAR